MTRSEALALLGLPENASRADVERQFRQLAKHHHPDAVPGDIHAATRFARLVAARNRLRDPTPDSDLPTDPQTQPHPSSQELYTPKPIFSVDVPADALLSGGFTTAETRRPCPDCQGTGWRKIQFFFNFSLPCPTCEGRGQIHRTLRVDLPPNLSPDSVVDIQGTLYRILPLLPEGFQRDGFHLILERRLRNGAFQRGTYIKCQIPGGWIRVRVPPATRPGTILRIPGRGLPNGCGGRGDLCIRLLPFPSF